MDKHFDAREAPRCPHCGAILRLPDILDAEDLMKLIDEAVKRRIENVLKSPPSNLPEPLAEALRNAIRE